jgi:exopolysaccharide biosynthesis protein
MNTSVQAQQHGCVLGMNGGPGAFQPPHCTGVLISDGKVMESKLKGSHGGGFGVTNDGYFFMGHFNQTDFQAIPFYNYIFGFDWLLRDGKISKYADPTNTFVAARSSIGWNSKGEIMILEVDGVETSKPPMGLTLNQLALWWIKLGAVNAYNLDGGGSSTVFYEGKVTNNPHGHENPNVIEQRMISNIVCFK